MLKTFAAIVTTVLVVLATAYFGFFRDYDANFKKQVLEAEAMCATLEKMLVGYTKYTDYVSVGKKTVSEQAKFLAASVMREYIHNQHITRSMVLFNANGLASIRYSVEYSFGYDLAPGKFDVRAEQNGIQILVGRPIVVASPAVKVLSYSVSGMPILTDPQQAAMNQMINLPNTAKLQAQHLVNEPEIHALCEKKLIEFLRRFLEKQPGVTMLPNITIAYRK